MHIDWGSVPGYFGGIALLLTIVTLQRDHKERNRAQASKVAAWAVPPKHGEEPKFHVLLRNASELPVTGVTVVIAAEKTVRKQRLRKDQGPEGPLRNVFRYRNELAPGTTEDIWEFSSPVEVKSLEFTDSSGRTWYRTNTRLYSKPPWLKAVRQARRKARWNQLLRKSSSASQ